MKGRQIIGKDGRSPIFFLIFSIKCYKNAVVTYRYTSLSRRKASRLSFIDKEVSFFSFAVYFEHFVGLYGKAITHNKRSGLTRARWIILCFVNDALRAEAQIV